MSSQPDPFYIKASGSQIPTQGFVKPGFRRLKKTSIIKPEEEEEAATTGRMHSNSESATASTVVGDRNTVLFLQISFFEFIPTCLCIGFVSFSFHIKKGGEEREHIGMVRYLRFVIPFQFKSPSSHIHAFSLSRLFHYGLDGGFCHDPCSTKRTAENNVAIFWDLDNKPPSSFPPYDAAVRLKLAASSFGAVRYMVAYANRHAFSYVPPIVRDQRKERKALDRLETKGVIKPAEPYICRVCGRKFHTNEKLLNHFKQLHEREQIKRLNRLESARGKQRVQLAAKFSMKMEKYKKAVNGVLTPKVGYGLADELKRAGFWVRTVSDKPQAADTALRNHMVDMMDRQCVGCLVLVSDDSDFVDVLKEARLRCLQTVVVGDNNDGALKRCADTGFSWTDITAGKAKKEAVSVVGRWRDRDILKKLEWTYKPEVEKCEYDPNESEVKSENGDIEDTIFEGDSLAWKEDARPWWELESDTEGTAASFKG